MPIKPRAEHPARAHAPLTRSRARLARRARLVCRADTYTQIDKLHYDLLQHYLTWTPGSA
mgnify:CR=1 FL=1